VGIYTNWNTRLSRTKKEIILTLIFINMAIRKNKLLKSMNEAKKTAGKKSIQGLITGAVTIGGAALTNFAGDKVPANTRKFIGAGMTGFGIAVKIFAKDENIDAAANGLIAVGTYQMVMDFGTDKIIESVKLTKAIPATTENKPVDENGTVIEGLGKWNWEALYKDYSQSQEPDLETDIEETSMSGTEKQNAEVINAEAFI